MKKQVKCANLVFGNNQYATKHKVYIQSMLNRPADDILGNIKQAKELASAGCEIIRASVPEPANAKLIYELKNSLSDCNVPVVADIHFNAKCATEAIEAGADKIRLNPGNFPHNKLEEIIYLCKQKGIPVRVGINGGSLPGVRKQGDSSQDEKPIYERAVLCALDYVKQLNSFDFDDIVISVKLSNVNDTVLAYRMLNSLTSYPLHIGVTESGTLKSGTLKSAIGLGSLLIDGIGDTMRVSLSANPVEEVSVAKEILRSVGLLNQGVEVIACPTCGRTKINVIHLAEEAEKMFSRSNLNIKIAVMGCVVNGPGEAKCADYGICGGDGEGLIFAKGKIIKKVSEENLLDELKLIVESQF